MQSLEKASSSVVPKNDEISQVEGTWRLSKTGLLLPQPGWMKNWTLLKRFWALGRFLHVGQSIPWLDTVMT